MNFSESTKSKSLREGIAALTHLNYDGAIVLDADNQMAPDFLLEANRYMSAGFRVIQGQRTAPPLSGLNEIARWDAISEAINNHILCAGHHAMGMSARLAGSGMIFDFKLFEEVMQEVNAIGGFDKELELRLTEMGESIAYAEDALVYDEKVASSEVFARQRGRWLAAQYTYGRRFIFILNISSFALAIPPSMWESASWMLVSQLPQLVWQACRAVVMIPASAKTFYHTPHVEAVTVKKEEVHV